MLLTDKYADKIYGTITCYDRMIIQGYIPGWSHAEGMTGYLNANNIPPSLLRSRSAQTSNTSQMKTTLKSSSFVPQGCSDSENRKDRRVDPHLFRHGTVQYL